MLRVPMLVMVLGTEARLLPMLLSRWVWTGIGAVTAAAIVPS